MKKTFGVHVCYFPNTILYLPVATSLTLFRPLLLTLPFLLRFAFFLCFPAFPAPFSRTLPPHSSIYIHI